jgi:hypothetical protein
MMRNPKISTAGNGSFVAIRNPPRRHRLISWSGSCDGLPRHECLLNRVPQIVEIKRFRDYLRNPELGELFSVVHARKVQHDHKMGLWKLGMQPAKPILQVRTVSVRIHNNRIAKLNAVGIPRTSLDPFYFPAKTVNGVPKHFKLILSPGTNSDHLNFLKRPGFGRLQNPIGGRERLLRMPARYAFGFQLIDEFLKSSRPLVPINSNHTGQGFPVRVSPSHQLPKTATRGVFPR